MIFFRRALRFPAPPLLAGALFIAACGGADRLQGSAERRTVGTAGLGADTKTLMRAIHDNDVKGARRLIAAGAPPDAKNEDGLTPIHLASHLGRETILDVLIQAEADVDAALVDGTTSLMLAALEGHTGTASKLMAAGADINTQNAKGVTALMMAVVKGHVDTVRLLLDRGADPNLFDRFGDTAVVGAAATGNIDALEALLAFARRLEHTDRALTEACVAGHTRAVAMLADHGADIEAKGRDGWTCLMLAAWKGHRDIVDAALTRGADVNAADGRGFSALMAAAAAGQEDVVSLFLRRGADLSGHDQDGHTPMSLAEANRDAAVAEVLWKAAGLPSKTLVSDIEDRDLSKPLDCPFESVSRFEGDLMSYTEPVMWHPAEAGVLWGRGWTRFSQVRSSKAVPVEVCGAFGEITYLMGLTCEEGSAPFGRPDQAAAARAGSVGQGGRCGKMVDLYIVHCPEASYQIYVDMYHCTPFD